MLETGCWLPIVFLTPGAIPDIDGDVLHAHILLPQGTPLSRNEAVVKRVVKALQKVNEDPIPLQPGKRPLVENVYVNFNYNVDSFESGPHVATVSADLLGAENRSSPMDDIASRWRKEVVEVSDVINITYKEPVIGPGGLAIDIRLKGDSLDRLKTGVIRIDGLAQLIRRCSGLKR